MIVLLDDPSTVHGILLELPNPHATYDPIVNWYWGKYTEIVDRLDWEMIPMILIVNIIGEEELLFDL